MTTYMSTDNECWIEEHKGKYRCGHRGYNAPKIWFDTTKEAGDHYGLTKEDIVDCLNDSYATTEE